jgi:peptide/nickel transport system permease protein
MRAARRLGRRLGRTLLLVLLVAAGTLALVRYAPGYFADRRELDAQHAEGVRTELESRRVAEHSAAAMAWVVAAGWLHGKLGMSRQYDVPVWEMVKPRLPVTLSLLARALAFGWVSAIALALPLSAMRGRQAEVPVAVASAVSLAIPIGALATLFLLTNLGGPALAIGLVIAARDFKFLYRLLRREWRAPHVFYARAQGVSTRRIAAAYLLPALAPQLLALLTMSFVLALSMAVPAEVIFDVPGLGQLAWTAATNRDAPVLLTVTLCMAAAVGVAGTFRTFAADSASRLEAA